MRRSLIAASLLVTMTSACTMQSGNRHVLMAGGAGLVGVGILVARPTAVDQNHDGINQTALDDDYSGLVPGMLMVIAGAILFAAGASAAEPVAALPVYQPPPPPPAPVYPVIGYGPPGTVQLAPEHALPELPASPEALRLGQQIRSAVDRGHCDAAWVMWRSLAQRDPNYAVALHASPVMDRCPVDEGAQ